MWLLDEDIDQDQKQTHMWQHISSRSFEFFLLLLLKCVFNCSPIFLFIVVFNIIFTLFSIYYNIMLFDRTYINLIEYILIVNKILDYVWNFFVMIPSVYNISQVVRLKFKLERTNASAKIYRQQQN